MGPAWIGSPRSREWAFNSATQLPVRRQPLWDCGATSNAPGLSSAAEDIRDCLDGTVFTKPVLGLTSPCLSVCVCRQTPAWLEQMIAHTTWRDLFYKLAEAHPDCLMLNFTVKVGRGPEVEKDRSVHEQWLSLRMVSVCMWGGDLSPLRDCICFVGKGLHRFICVSPT